MNEDYEDLRPGFNLATEPVLSVKSADQEIAPTPALGRGVSSMTGELHGDPADASNTEATDKLGTPCYIAVIESEHDLAKTFKLRASAAFKSLGFKASASLEYFRSRTFHRYTVSIVALVKVYTGSERLNPVTLRGPALHRAQESPATYYSFYSDEIVREVVYGGSLFVVFDFDTQTETEAEEIKAALGFRAKGVKGSVETKSSLEEVVKKSTFFLTMIAEGAKPDVLPIEGRTEVKDEETKKQILDFIASYPSRVSDEIRNVVGYASDPAHEADNWPSDEPMDVSAALRKIEDWAALRRKGSTLLGELSYVLDHPTRFVDPDKDEITAAHDELDKWLITIDRAAEDVIKNPWGALPEVDEGRIEEIRELLPAERVLPRPRIVAEFRNDRMESSSTVTVNLNSNVNTGWIGPKPGSYSPLVNLRLQCMPPMQDANLVIHAKANGGEGSAVEGERVLPSDSPIYLFGCELQGPGAANYFLEYHLHIADHGDRGPFPGDSELRGVNQAHGIQAIRIELRPI